jgi:hypothetical protein
VSPEPDNTTGLNGASDMPNSSRIDDHSFQDSGRVVPRLSSINQSITGLDFLDSCEYITPLASPGNQLCDLDETGSRFSAAVTLDRNGSTADNASNDLSRTQSPSDCLWPLKTDEDSILLRYFITDLSVWVRKHLFKFFPFIVNITSELQLLADIVSV